MTSDDRPGGVWRVCPVMSLHVPLSKIHVSFIEQTEPQPPNRTTYWSIGSYAIAESSWAPGRTPVPFVQFPVGGGGAAAGPHDALPEELPRQLSGCPPAGPAPLSRDCSAQLNRVDGAPEAMWAASPEIAPSPGHADVATKLNTVRRMHSRTDPAPRFRTTRGLDCHIARLGPGAPFKGFYPPVLSPSPSRWPIRTVGRILRRRVGRAPLRGIHDRRAP